MNEQDAQMKQRIMAEAEVAIDELLRQRKPAEEIKLSEIEVLVRELGQRLMASASQALVTASADRQDVVLTCEQCGERMQYKGRKRRGVETETGAVMVERAYYYCARCKAGVFPPGPAVGTGWERLQ